MMAVPAAVVVVRFKAIDKPCTPRPSTSQHRFIKPHQFTIHLGSLHAEATSQPHHAAVAQVARRSRATHHQHNSTEILAAVAAAPMAGAVPINLIILPCESRVHRLRHLSQSTTTHRRFPILQQA